jgi:hypothetical protein
MGLDPRAAHPSPPAGGHVAAGAAPAVISIAALPFALLVPGLSDGRDRRRWIAGSAAVMAVGAFALSASRSQPWGRS